MSTRWKSVGLAALSGAAMGALWLPTGLAPFFPLAVFVALRGLRMVETGKQALAFGVVFGVFRYAVAAHFLLALLRYSPLAILFYLLAVAYIIPFAALEGWGALWLERRLELPRAVGFGVLYASLEWLRTLGELSFPADSLAHGFGDTPAWLAWTSWSGPFGLTLLVFLVGVLLDWAWESRGRPRFALAVAVGAVAVWLGPAATDLVPDGDHGSSLRVGLVQPAVSVRDKFDRSLHPEVWARLERLSHRAAEGADLVLWPESARPGAVVVRDGERFRDPEMESLSRRVGVPILYGCEIAWVTDGHVNALFNGAAIAYPDGRQGEWYGKQRLLPFAEGVPFARAFGHDPRSSTASSRSRNSYLTMMGNFDPGPGPKIFEVGDARIGVLICYEGMYPDLGREYRRAGANVLALLTNDAWWGNSAFAPWHAKMMSSRSRELGVPVIRAANSGISSVIDRKGRTVTSSMLFETTSLDASVSLPASGATYYAGVGNWTVVASALLVLLWAVAVRIRKIRRVPVPRGTEEPIDSAPDEGPIAV